jgi:putative hydrolase of HD superfamily
MNIKKILNFTEFIIKFNQLERRIYATGENRFENDSEHSFQLAMVSWYIISTENLKYDIDKIIKYSLVHDLVEIYAGDTFFYADKASKELKVQKEKAAVEKMGKEFSEFPELLKLIHEYEKKEDPESEFVYTLDKILPVMNIYLDEGRSWRKHKIKFDMLVEVKNKVVINKDVQKVWEGLVGLVEKRKTELFGENEGV